ncbi:DNA repair exonuclease [Bacillus sp. Marseille-Q1617]|uniref:metallophosphoesterase family protein n=1 Tax=Bacillus sp. Marseille-Q1617 TaxID=2736887 RepID=UPI00158B00FE|nr:DNA repair exonuclease [Bacillus sp. Marseille-Q1617]
MEKIRFIHCADLHLDSPFAGLKHLPAELFERIQNSTFASFEKMVKVAIQRQIDFMMISGDLFDEEDRSIRAQAKLMNQFSLLGESGIPVFVIHGNHDHLGGFRLELDMPENVHIFDEKTEVKELVTKSGASVKLAGFSYGSRHIRERRISDYPKQVEADYKIGLLHGSEGSVQSAHESYAPFSMRELKEKNYHYWALGHIHQRQILNHEPPIVYPGNIQGRHRKETGEKGCYLVELSEHDAILEFIPTQDIIWGEMEISLEGVERFGEIFQLIRKSAEEYKVMGDCLLQVEVKDFNLLSPEVIQAIENGDLLQALQADLPTGETMKWIHSIKLSRSENIDIDTKDPFINDVIHTLRNMRVEEGGEALAELYEHPSFYRYIDSLKEEELSHLIEETVELILHPSRCQ